MRVTDSMSERNLLYNLYSAENRLQVLQDQATSGKTITRPQDDPVGTERSITIRHHLEQNRQYMRNVDGARTWLDRVEESLSQVTSVLSRANELGLQGASGTTPPAARQAIAMEIDQLAQETQSVRQRTVERGRLLFDDTQPRWKVSADVTIEGPTGVGALLDNVRSAMERLSHGLNSGLQDEIQTALSELEKYTDRVLEYRAANGAKMRRLDILEDKMKSLDVEYQRVMSNIEDADLTEVIVKLKSAEAAYQAALAAGARLIQPSLLDHLR